MCTHTMYGETEDELIENAKKYGIEVHGYTEESCKEEKAEKKEHFRKVIKSTWIFNSLFFYYLFKLDRFVD